MAKATKTSGRKTAKKKRSAKAKVSRVNNKKAFRSYKKAIEYLFTSTNYENEKRLRYNVTTFNLDRMNKLLSLMGNPHQKIKTVHIVGTKGKGSTATMLAKMLEANDYNVGLYTSPHLVHLHERITINSGLISESEMLELINRTYAPVEKLAKDDAPTFFEIMTAMAFRHFADKQVDIAVIETGLGGRLDSTNVIEPLAVGVTNLSIDHHRQLGNTIEQIATEKAGVFKSEVPVISVDQTPDALKVLKRHAKKVKAPLKVTGRDIDFSYRFEASRRHGPHTRICLTTPTSKFEHLRVPVQGNHQAVNCSLALALLDQLKNKGFEIDNEKTAQGLNSVSLLGRMEMIFQDPRIIIDAAHNAESIRALIHAIGQNVPYDSMVVIFGCNEDKDVKGMLRELQFGADKVIFTRSNSAKAMSPQKLGEIYTEISGNMYQTASCLGGALQLAQNAVGREDLICITGSFYLIGQAKKRFSKK